ncbi:MAG: hypothetical protein E6G01_16285 [Actinobacteria bacterium]|nr:MAG: hypothetical protein E6G01_16285 [Actinomycetota bacterium]
MERLVRHGRLRRHLHASSDPHLPEAGDRRRCVEQDPSCGHFRVQLWQQLQRNLAAAFATVDVERTQSAEQLVDGAGRPITGHAAVDNVTNVAVIVMVFWNPDRGVRFRDEYEENPDGTLRETRFIPGGRGSSLFPACQNMILAAQALGVQSLFTTFFGLVDRQVKALLHVPPRMFLESAVFLGYADEELKRPRRKPLLDVVHLNDWDNHWGGSPEARF